MPKLKMKESGKRFNFSGIGFKLILILILICQIPLNTFGVLAYNKANNILYDKLKTTAGQELELVSGSIDNYFSGVSATTKMLSNNVDLTQIAIHPEYASFALELFREAKESNSDIEQIVFSTIDKKIVRYPAQETKAGYDPTTRPWYKGAIEKQDDINYSEPYKNSTGKFVVSISKTVMNNGTLVGVVSVDVDLKNLSEKLSKVKVGNSGYAFISDAEGLMIAHPDSSLIGGDITTKQSYWNEVKSNPRGFTKYTYNGQNKFASYSTNAVTGWKIMASMQQKELNDDTDDIRNLLIIIIAIFLPLNILVAYIFSKSIKKNINKLKDVFKKASAGDLTERIKINSKDEFEELANSFNEMTDGICALIGTAKESSDIINKTSVSISAMSGQTTNAVADIAKTIDQVASGSTEQAKDIEDGVSELQSLVFKLQEINEKTKSMFKVSENTDEMTKDGLVVMDLLSSKSKDTNNASDKIEIAVRDMSEASSNIKAITSSINEIAEQTNLLALNAAIEAARAGEAGKGFSIVADEIRKLAEQSTEATKDIEALIDQVDDKSKIAVRAVSEAKTTISEQGEAVTKTKVTFVDISKAIENLSNMISSVQSSINDINRDKDSIMEKMQNLSAISEETAASTEEVSAATEEVSASMDDFNENAQRLKSLSEELNNDINKFTI
ncbi:methyl-accepting chemotaxis protein [Clostridium sp. C8-1-8]|uniref:methyl-accepting chemotaxis protein n=1 Tax=Clostridium sp. C8-1-8 TaxID=2698831 RepID=UPI00136DFCE4|nr:methyl-accepting chemotaxis protein [Clostridium sp. C8-1-8]